MELYRARPDEREVELPGDRLLAEPIMTVTNAVSIAAPPESVWPWLAQMGAGRAGWYSYDRLDNGGAPSATEIVEELQSVAPGDVFPALPGAQDAFVVDEVVPNHHLVLVVPMPDAPGPQATWVHVLHDDHGGSRLVVRARLARVRVDLPVVGHVDMPRWLIRSLGRPAHLVMQRLALTEIKRRAESHVRGEPVLSRAEWRRMTIEHAADTRFERLAIWLLRATRFRLARLSGHDVAILTTRGRRTGRRRSVVLQYFTDGDVPVVVAANSGRAAPPGWYFNLSSDPEARLETAGRTRSVRAEEMSATQAEAFWSRVLDADPGYSRYRRRTNRRIPMMRLLPAGG